MQNVAEVMGNAALALPLKRPSISFKPASFVSELVGSNGKATAAFTLSNVTFGYDGNQPLPAGALSVGKATAEAARAAAVPLCSEQIFTAGNLVLDSVVIGPRTAELASVAYNQTLSVGLAVSAAADAAVLALPNADVIFQISPQTTPGVEFSTGSYNITGSLVATADLTSPKSYLEVEEAEVGWKSQQRLAAPVVQGGDKAPTPRYITGASTGCMVTGASALAVPGSSSSSSAESATPTQARSAAGVAHVSAVGMAAACVAAAAAAML
jgi:hypothetical protein